MNISSELGSFFSTIAPIRAGDRLLVAFSGGPDSTALLWGLRELLPGLGVEVQAVHVDHGLDRDSSRRAAAARRLCRRLDIPVSMIRREVANEARRGESLEAAARRVRYAALEHQRQRLAARYVATAHHADDQIETVLLRLLYGTGLAGLAGIQPRRGRVIRPLLTLPRHDLLRLLGAIGLAPVDDPTNYRLRIPRNRLRHLVRPRLSEGEPELGPALLGLAAAARGARAALAKRLHSELGLRPTPAGPAILMRKLAALPAECWPFALSLLHEQAGLLYPPPRSARRDLRRQLARGDHVGCDCGGGWRWESDGELLKLLRPAPPSSPFAYTLTVPGECEIVELSLRFRLRRGAVAHWMFRPSSRRTGLDLPLAPGDDVVVRSRRAGDRLRPFGCSYSRRLKDLLIDRRVPRAERGRLPLLEVGSRLAWVPGVTIDDSFRLAGGDQAWIAELEPL